MTLILIFLAACDPSVESECASLCETYWMTCAEHTVTGGNLTAAGELRAECVTGCDAYPEMDVREQEEMATYTACADEWIADVEKYEADIESCNDACGVRDFTAAAQESAREN